MRLAQLRKTFDRIYPTTDGNMHMDHIMIMLWYTDFKKVHKDLGIYIDWHTVRDIKEACRPKAKV